MNHHPSQHYAVVVVDHEPNNIDDDSSTLLRPQQITTTNTTTTTPTNYEPLNSHHHSLYSNTPTTTTSPHHPFYHHSSTTTTSHLLHHHHSAAIGSGLVLHAPTTTSTTTTTTNNQTSTHSHNCTSMVESTSSPHASSPALSANIINSNNLNINNSGSNNNNNLNHHISSSSPSINPQECNGGGSSSSTSGLLFSDSNSNNITTSVTNNGNNNSENTQVLQELFRQQQLQSSYPYGHSGSHPFIEIQASHLSNNLTQDYSGHATGTSGSTNAIPSHSTPTDSYMVHTTEGSYHHSLHHEDGTSQPQDTSYDLLLNVVGVRNDHSNGGASAVHAHNYLVTNQQQGIDTHASTSHHHILNATHPIHHHHHSASQLVHHHALNNFSNSNDYVRFDDHLFSLLQSNSTHDHSHTSSSSTHLNHNNNNNNNTNATMDTTGLMDSLTNPNAQSSQNVTSDSQLSLQIHHSNHHHSSTTQHAGQTQPSHVPSPLQHHGWKGEKGLNCFNYFDVAYDPTTTTSTSTTIGNQHTNSSSTPMVEATDAAAVVHHSQHQHQHQNQHQNQQQQQHSQLMNPLEQVVVVNAAAVHSTALSLIKPMNSYHSNDLSSPVQTTTTTTNLSHHVFHPASMVDSQQQQQFSNIHHQVTTTNPYHTSAASFMNTYGMQMTHQQVPPPPPPHNNLNTMMMNPAAVQQQQQFSQQQQQQHLPNTTCSPVQTTMMIPSSHHHSNVGGGAPTYVLNSPTTMACMTTTTSNPPPPPLPSSTTTTTTTTTQHSPHQFNASQKKAISSKSKIITMTTMLDGSKQVITQSKMNLSMDDPNAAAASPTICNCCGRSDSEVSFKKNYSIHEGNIESYRSTFPQNSESITPGPVCATCYNKQWRYQRGLYDPQKSSSSRKNTSRDLGGKHASTSPQAISSSPQTPLQNNRVTAIQNDYSSSYSGSPVSTKQNSFGGVHSGLKKRRPPSLVSSSHSSSPSSSSVNHHGTHRGQVEEGTAVVEEVGNGGETMTTLVHNKRVKTHHFNNHTDWLLEKSKRNHISNDEISIIVQFYQVLEWNVQAQQQQQHEEEEEWNVKTRTNTEEISVEHQTSIVTVPQDNSNSRNQQQQVSMLTKLIMEDGFNHCEILQDVIREFNDQQLAIQKQLMYGVCFDSATTTNLMENHARRRHDQHDSCKSELLNLPLHSSNNNNHSRMDSTRFRLRHYYTTALRLDLKDFELPVLSVPASTGAADEQMMVLCNSSSIMMEDVTPTSLTSGSSSNNDNNGENSAMGTTTVEQQHDTPNQVSAALQGKHALNTLKSQLVSRLSELLYTKQPVLDSTNLTTTTRKKSSTSTSDDIASESFQEMAGTMPEDQRCYLPVSSPIVICMKITSMDRFQNLVLLDLDEFYMMERSLCEGDSLSVFFV